VKAILGRAGVIDLDEDALDLLVPERIPDGDPLACIDCDPSAVAPLFRLSGIPGDAFADWTARLKDLGMLDDRRRTRGHRMTPEQAREAARKRWRK
jgi:hypothetical protein